jgi:2-oxoacid:acceptor oxidoreductase delta subunit (pyruvate/2-ketoisovalerate family)
MKERYKKYTVEIPEEMAIPFAGIVESPKPNGEQPMMLTGGWRIYRPVIDSEKCVMCKSCILACPDATVLLVDGGNKIGFNLDYCKGCGLCTWVCPVNAIDRVPELDFEDGVPFQDALFLLPHVEALYAD